MDRVKGAGRGGSFQLSFPDAASALGFYALFNDYHWESDSYHCVVVGLDNQDFQSELNNPMLKSCFDDPSDITSEKVYDILHMQVQLYL